MLVGGLSRWSAHGNPTCKAPISRERICLATSLVGIAILTFITWQQCQTWRDSDTLWRQAIRHGGAEIADLHNNLGVWRAKEGDFESAIAEFEQAIRVQPGRHESYMNLANAFRQKGDTVGVITTLRRATYRWPEDVHIHGLLGKILFLTGRYLAASDQYMVITQLRPNESFAHIFLGHVLKRGGRFKEAAIQYAEALRLVPQDQEARQGWNETRRLIEYTELRPEGEAPLRN